MNDIKENVFAGTYDQKKEMIGKDCIIIPRKFLMRGLFIFSANDKIKKGKAGVDVCQERVRQARESYDIARCSEEISLF